MTSNQVTTSRLTLLTFAGIRAALAAGLRHTEIAREFGVSVWTIQRIASDRTLEGDELTDDDMPLDDAPPDYVPRNLRRCPECGGMVYVWPCLACRMAVSEGPALAPEAKNRQAEAKECKPAAAGRPSIASASRKERTSEKRLTRRRRRRRARRRARRNRSRARS